MPEVFGSVYDVRVLLDSTSKMMDGKKLTDMKLPLEAKLAAKAALKRSKAPWWKSCWSATTSSDPL